MERYGSFLSHLRMSAHCTQEDVAILVCSNKTAISRLESGETCPPFTSHRRKIVIDIAEILCSSPRETQRYLDLAHIEQDLLTDEEEIQLDVVSLIHVKEREALHRFHEISQQRLSHFEERQKAFQGQQLPEKLLVKMEEYRQKINRIEQRLGQGGAISFSMKEKRHTHHVYYAEIVEGKITMGNHYGKEFNKHMLPSSLFTLASENAQWLMDLADIERLAVDDAILLTNCKKFQGWIPGEIKTTVLTSSLPIPDDLESLRQEKRALIEKDFYNSSHYRLVSYSPSFTDFEQLEVTLAPVSFHEFYSLVPFCDEPLLRDSSGSPLSIRQKYGHTALHYSSTEKVTSLIPTPISIQCVLVTKDRFIVLMRRSSSVAYYPNHWSASFEETMNAPGLNRKGQPSRSDDADFFAGALRGLDEEFAIPPEAVENIKVLSLNVEYLTLSMDVIMLIQVNLTGEEIREQWLVEADDRDEASKFVLLSADLDSVTEKLFSTTLWHPTARMRLIQYLFHTYGTQQVAEHLKQFHTHVA